MRMQHLVAVIARKPPTAGLVEDGRYARGAGHDPKEIVP